VENQAVHDIRSSLVRGERRVPLATKSSRAGAGAKDGSLAGITIRRDEHRRSDQRREGRQINVIDQAVITHQRRHHEVAVLNVSSRGAMIQTDLVPRIGAQLEIRFADCNRTQCFVRWVRGGRIGLEFDKETLVIGASEAEAHYISGRRLGEFPTLEVKSARAPRQGLMLRAELHWPQGSMSVKLRNISAEGAMLQASQDLHEHAEVVLEIPEIAAIAGRVRWCRSKQIGVRFDNVFDLCDLSNKPVEPNFEKIEKLDYLKPDYLRSESDPNSPWAAPKRPLSPDDL